MKEVTRERIIYGIVVVLIAVGIRVAFMVVGSSQFDYLKEVGPFLNDTSYNDRLNNITDIQEAELRLLHQREYARRDFIWTNYVKQHGLNGKNLALSVVKALRPFQGNITAQQTHKACSLQETDAICFFVINGKVLTTKLKKEPAKKIAQQVADLLYQTQASVGDKLPNMLFTYNIMPMPRVIPGENVSSLNATIGPNFFEPMFRKLCNNTAKQLDHHGAHLYHPAKSFVVHESVPVFSPSVIPGCTQDIPFPHHDYSTWHKEYARVIRRNRTPWKERIPKLFWRGNITNAVMPPDKLATLPFVKYLIKNKPDAYMDIQISHSMIDGSRFNSTNGSILYDAWRYQFVLDMDDITHSINFAKLLGSGAIVFKHEPVFTEFFYDWVVPDMHIIRVMQDFSNMTAVVKELRGEGWHRQQWGERISYEANMFFKQQLKPESIYAYIYRMFTVYSFYHIDQYIAKECKNCVEY